MAKMRLRKRDRVAQAGKGNRQEIYVYGAKKRRDKIFPTTVIKQRG
ncbi:hypothetical protein ES705_29071 [subsurface metagenome]